MCWRWEWIKFIKSSGGAILLGLFHSESGVLKLWLETPFLPETLIKVQALDSPWLTSTQDMARKKNRLDKSIPTLLCKSSQSWLYSAWKTLPPIHRIVGGSWGGKWPSGAPSLQELSQHFLRSCRCRDGFHFKRFQSSRNFIIVDLYSLVSLCGYCRARTSNPALKSLSSSRQWSIHPIFWHTFQVEP